MYHDYEADTRMKSPVAVIAPAARASLRNTLQGDHGVSTAVLHFVPVGVECLDGPIELPIELAPDCAFGNYLVTRMIYNPDSTDEIALHLWLGEKEVA